MISKGNVIKMEEFKIVMQVLYNENKYVVLLNSKHQKYFLRILDDGEFMYPTMQEFTELYSIFENNEIKNKCYQKDFQINGQNSKLNHKKLKFEPKVIFGKTLISLVTAISILGCGQKVKAEWKKQEIITKEQIQTQIDLIENFENTNQENSSNEVVTIQRFAPNEYKLLTGNSGKDLYFDSVDEFSAYLDEEVPTYQKIENKIMQDRNIPQKYKGIFIDGLENLKETMPNLNLSVLNQHLKRGLKIVEKTSKEITEQEGENSIASFDKSSSTMFINPQNINEETLLHELAHAITGIIMQKDEKNIYMGTEAIIYFKDIENLEIYGSGFSEGIADIIAQNALGDKGIQNASYQPISEQLEIMLNVTKINSTDFVNKGTTRFIQKAERVGIENVYDNISSCDMLCTALQQGISIKPEMSVKQNLYDFLIKYALKQLDEGINRETIIKNIDNAIFNTTFSNVVVFENNRAVEELEMIDLRNEIVDEIQNRNVNIKEERD